MTDRRVRDTKVLALDVERVADHLVSELRHLVGRDLRRRGVVLGVSGGVDSALCAALAVRAFGPGRVRALQTPERECSETTNRMGRLVCDRFGLEPVMEDITAALEGMGCYARKEEAVQRVFPEYGPGWRMKVAVADGLLETGRVNYFHLVVESPDGRREQLRAPLDVYLQVVAATNLKQRLRKTMEYYHAESLNYAVIGTPNRLEHALGFFVRGGDGLADLKPIAHLYKTQVFALAEYLGVPREILDRPPSTDTYSLPQTQEEFYFALHHTDMDLLLWAYEKGLSPADAALEFDFPATQIEHVYRDIEAKRRKAESLERPAALAAPLAPESAVSAAQRKEGADVTRP